MLYVTVPVGIELCKQTGATFPMQTVARYQRASGGSAELEVPFGRTAVSKAFSAHGLLVGRGAAPPCTP